MGHSTMEIPVSMSMACWSLVKVRAASLITVLLALTLQATGLAQPVPFGGVAGGDAWQRGEFAVAYEAAKRVDTVAAQLLASRAAADQAVYLESEDDGALDWLELAEEAAARAIELDPDGAWAAAATMALARAKGEAGLYRGALANSRLPGELQTLFERALELDPENADALIAYGAWHFALTEIGVGWLYGGNRRSVLPQMERGIAAAPEQLNLRVEYARTLKGLGHDEEARQQLEIALAMTPETAAEEYEQERARELLASY